MKYILVEQKRCFNIKMCFDMFNSFIFNNFKLISYVIILQKIVEYIIKLQQERSQMQEEVWWFWEEIEEFNVIIIFCQQLFFVMGVFVIWCQFDYMRDMFDEYVKSWILQNWKFWIFSIIIKLLFELFKGMVFISSLEELY